MKPSDLVDIFRDLEFIKDKIDNPEHQQALTGWRVRTIPAAMVHPGLMKIIYERYGHTPDYEKARAAEGVAQLAETPAAPAEKTEGPAEGKQEQAENPDVGADRPASAKRGRKAKA